MTATPDAARFLERLEALRSDEEQAKYGRYFKTGPGDYAEGDFFTGVLMGDVFGLAREFGGMDLPNLESLLHQDIHEARAGAVKIMALQAAVGGIRLHIEVKERWRRWRRGTGACRPVGGALAVLADSM